MTVEAPSAPTSADEIAACPFCGAEGSAGRAFCPTCGQPGAPLPSGAVLRGTYAITEVLSASATGAVYRAQDRRRKRQVAVKELLAPVGSSAEDRATLQSAFVREARHLASLKHLCLPEVFDSFSQDGRHYLVMSLLPGQDARAVLATRRQGFSEPQVRAWSQHLFSLLEYLQQRHPAFVHGEIMPAHLMARTDGTPCLISYGLVWRLNLRPRITLPGAADAHVVQSSNATRKLLRGRDQAQEQLVDMPTGNDDLYGVGASLHSLLTGRDVFAGVSELALAFPPVRDLAPRVSVGLAEAVNRAVSPDHDARFASIGAFRAAMGLGGMTSRPAAQAEPRGRRRLVAFGILAAVIAIIASLVLYDQRNTANDSASTALGGATSRPSSPAITPAHTLAFADAFIHPIPAWVTDGQTSYQRGGELWLSNQNGGAPRDLIRTTYSTGTDGFVLRTTLRLAKGPSDAAYGLVAADRSGSHWDNVALLVQANGKWALLRYHNGHAPALIGWQPSTAIRTGHNTPNELQLAESPVSPGRPGTFTVTINGHTLAKAVPAGSGISAGRVGVMAGPGAVVAADALNVSSYPASTRTIEDHFFSNRLGWSLGADSPLHNSLLQVRPVAGQSWRLAAARKVQFAPGTGPFNVELTFNIHGPAPNGWQAGGLVFARPAPGVRAPDLVAAVDLQGRFSLVSLSDGKVHTLVGPIGGSQVRLGHGFNILRLRLTLSRATLTAQVYLNGDGVATYVRSAKGLQPAIGVVAIGDVGVDASALRLSGHGIHL